MNEIPYSKFERLKTVWSSWRLLKNASEMRGDVSFVHFEIKHYIVIKNVYLTNNYFNTCPWLEFELYCSTD